VSPSEEELVLCESAFRNQKFSHTWSGFIDRRRGRNRRTFILFQTTPLYLGSFPFLRLLIDFFPDVDKQNVNYVGDERYKRISDETLLFFTELIRLRLFSLFTQSNSCLGTRILRKI
jgi:hypothetical protein